VSIFARKIPAKMRRRGLTESDPKEAESESLLVGEDEEELMSDEDDSDYDDSSGSEPEVTLNILERQPRVTAGMKR
jgi:hypothetical protein